MKERTIDYVLRATWIAVAKMYNEEANKAGSTMATGFALLSIDPEKGTPSTSLGPKMGMEATSLSRSKNPADGRSVLIHLTEFGKEMRDYSKSVVISFDEAVKKEIPEEDLQKFIEVANKIMDLVATKKIHSGT